MKKIALSLLLSISGIVVWAQVDSIPSKRNSRQEKKDAKRDRINMQLRQEEEGEMIFNKQSVFGIKLATDGYGISYELGKFKSARLTTLYQFELSEKKHKKEQKQGASFNQFQVNSVIPGKINNFYQFKIGIGQQLLIGGKGNKNGVAVMALYGGGLTLGLLKPYYVDAQDNFQQRVRKTYPVIIDSGYVPLGAAGFTVGWKELKVKPGAYVKGAMRFDYGRFNEVVTAIEVGLGAEFYTAKIPQVVFNKEKQFFFNAYVALILGRRK